jgi:hypothetical protein
VNSRFDDMPVELSERGGPVRAMTDVVGCPVLVAASDGTAALSGYSREASALVVRRPHGDFQHALTLA